MKFLLLLLLAANLVAADAPIEEFKKTDPNLTYGGMVAFGASQLGTLDRFQNLGEPWRVLENGFGTARSDGGGSFAAGWGVFAGYGYRQLALVKLELWLSARDTQIADFPGADRANSTTYSRFVLEAPVMAELGWPKAFGVRGLRPYIQGGVYGERLIDGKKYSGFRGDSYTVNRWIGTPLEDWGWVIGVGIGYKMAALEWRFEEGQKDLDPLGPKPLYARNSYFVIVGRF